MMLKQVIMDRPNPVYCFSFRPDSCFSLREQVQYCGLHDIANDRAVACFPYCGTEAFVSGYLLQNGREERSRWERIAVVVVARRPLAPLLRAPRLPRPRQRPGGGRFVAPAEERSTVVVGANTTSYVVAILYYYGGMVAMPICSPKAAMLSVEPGRSAPDPFQL